jgi:hypothetical protein
VRVGLDLDNTIAGYDHLFLRLGRERGWLPDGFEGDKKRIVEKVRSLTEGETKWMELQGAAYGRHMGEAKLIDGVDRFLRVCRTKNVSIYIVSHKTQHAVIDPDGVDLREAALDWMTSKGFFAEEGYFLPRDHVFFEGTRVAKCQRIHELKCDHFVDDLEIVFREATFPAGVKRHLFHPGAGALPQGPFAAYRTWTEIADGIFDQA